MKTRDLVHVDHANGTREIRREMFITDEPCRCGRLLRRRDRLTYLYRYELLSGLPTTPACRPSCAEPQFSGVPLIGRPWGS